MDGFAMDKESLRDKGIACEAFSSVEMHIASQVRLNHKASKTVSQKHYPKAEPGLGHPSYELWKTKIPICAGSRMKIVPSLNVLA
jgi:hypothetical protein